MFGVAGWQSGWLVGVEVLARNSATHELSCSTVIATSQDSDVQSACSMYCCMYCMYCMHRVTLQSSIFFWGGGVSIYMSVEPFTGVHFRLFDG